MAVPAPKRFCSPLRSLVGTSTAHLFLNMRCIMARLSTPAGLLKTYDWPSFERICPPWPKTIAAKVDASCCTAHPYLLCPSLPLQAASSQVFQSLGGLSRPTCLSQSAL